MNTETTTEIAIQFTRAVIIAAYEADPRKGTSIYSRKEMRKRIRVINQSIAKALALLPVVAALGMLDLDDAKIVKECLRDAAARIARECDDATTAKAMKAALWPASDWTPEARARLPRNLLDRAEGYARIAESRAWRARREADAA